MSLDIFTYVSHISAKTHPNIKSYMSYQKEILCSTKLDQAEMFSSTTYIIILIKVFVFFGEPEYGWEVLKRVCGRVKLKQITKK